MRALQSTCSGESESERFCKKNIKYVQSLCKSLGEKVRAKPPQNQRDKLLLPITTPPMGKTARRELSQVENSMIIALFWFFRKISIISLITGRPW